MLKSYCTEYNLFANKLKIPGACPDPENKANAEDKLPS